MTYTACYHLTKKFLSDIQREKIIKEIYQMCLYLNVKKILQEKGINYQVFKNAKHAKFSNCSDDFLVIVLCSLSSVCKKFSNYDLKDFQNHRGSYYDIPLWVTSDE